MTRGQYLALCAAVVLLLAAFVTVNRVASEAQKAGFPVWKPKKRIVAGGTVKNSPPVRISMCICWDAARLTAASSIFKSPMISLAVLSRSMASL